MTCPHCRSSATTRRRHRTELGYRRFSCRNCRRRFNERTGSGFNHLQYPTDIVLLAVLWRLRYKLGFREVAELLLERGYEVTHETIRGWAFRFAPLFAGQLRARRRGRAGESWYIDETYVKVAGRWCYLYRAIDRDGGLLDSMLSEHRDRSAARRILRRLVEVTGGRPERITTDKLKSYAVAIRKEGLSAVHDQGLRANNRAENSHQPIRRRERKQQRFKSPGSAQRFLSIHAAVYNAFYVQRHLLSRGIFKEFRAETFAVWTRSCIAA